VHARDVDCRKKLFIGRKRIGMQRIAAKSVDINEDFRSVGDELPDPRIERRLIAVLWEGKPGEVERSCGREFAANAPLRHPMAIRRERLRAKRGRPRWPLLSTTHRRKRPAPRPPAGQVDGRPPLPLLLEKRERGRRTPVLGK